MSLINDALKRASTKPAEQRPDLPPAVPVVEPAAGHKMAGAVPIIALVVLAVVLMAAFFWMRGRKPEAVQAQAPAVETAQQAAPAQVAAAPAAPSAAQTLADPLHKAAALANTISTQNREGEAVAQTIAATAKTNPAEAPAPSTAPAAVATPAQAAPVAVAAAPAVVNEVRAAPVEPPSLKLQAIFFRMSHPTVVINGKTLARGESVDGVKVMEIRRNEVDVELNGQKQTLALR